MQKALLLKELRECGLYAGIAMLAQVHYVGAGMGLPLIPFLGAGRGNEIPFLGSERGLSFTIVAVIAAIVLGLHQSIWESWRQTSLFLLHRPMPRTQIFLVKIAAGCLLVFGISVVPLVVYALWAAAPGTHASPFFWSMTEPWWRSVAVAFVAYLAAFLTGLRPAQWLGSKTWPLIATVLMAIALRAIPIWSSVIYLGYACMASCLVLMIIETERVREYP